jgi:hypothetical protein
VLPAVAMFEMRMLVPRSVTRINADFDEKGHVE